MFSKMKSVYKIVKGKFFNMYILFLSRFSIGKKQQMSLQDLLAMQQMNGELLRLDIIVRYLAIKDYYGRQMNGISGFELYKKMQDTRIEKGYSVDAEDKFRKLIASYENHGYDEKSRVIVDKNLHIIDGSHRVAMGLYHEMDCISVLILNVEYSVKDYSIDWFYQNGFTDEEMDLIKQASEEVVSKNPIRFTGIIWSPASRYQADIIKDMARFGIISDVRNYVYTREQYNNIVRKIYAIDDIDEWKVNKKINYMEPYNTEIISFHITFDDPQFRVKKLSNLPISKKVERVKKNIRTKYREYVDQYFFDIILHISDNAYQSRFMDRVLNPEIDMKRCISILNQFSYALIKTEVPYFPLNFPEEIPVGKDLDIICSRDDYAPLLKELKNFAVESEVYDIVFKKMRNDKANTQIRFEIAGKLILQLDVAYKIPHQIADVVSVALEKRVLKDGYYVLDDVYEYLVRMVTYTDKPNKKYHLEYLKAHQSVYSEELASKYLDKQAIHFIRKELGKKYN